MHQYRERLQAFLIANPLQRSGSGTETLLDDLHWYYMENNPYTNTTTRRFWGEIDAQIAHLSSEEQDKLISTFCSLCLEQEKLAFRGGIQIATQLMLEADV